jgi:hypothetical protein
MHWNLKRFAQKTNRMAMAAACDSVDLPEERFDEAVCEMGEVLHCRMINMVALCAPESEAAQIMNELDSLFRGMCG